MILSPASPAAPVAWRRRCTFTSGLWRAARRSAARDKAETAHAFQRRGPLSGVVSLAIPSIPGSAPGKHRHPTAPTRFAVDDAEHPPNALSGRLVRGDESGLHPA